MQRDLVWELTSSILNLLISLTEAQDEIVEAASKLPVVIKFLFGLLSLDLTPIPVQNEALSCLTALTEDNKVLCKQITEHAEWLDGLIHLKDMGSMKGVAACGVLHNIFTSLQWYDHNTPRAGASDAMLIPTLVESLETASLQKHGSNGHGTNSSPDQVLQLALEITASIATSLQEALEHGSRHEEKFEGFGDVDKEPKGDDVMDDDSDVLDEEDGGVPGGEEDDEMNEDDIIADMDLVTGDGPDDEDDSSQDMTLDRLVRRAAPKVLTLATTNNSTQTHALSTLNNIAWIVSSVDFSNGHSSSLRDFWTPLAQRAWDEIITPVLASNTADIELASTITSLAWAICRSAPGMIVIKPDEHRKFMALYQASRTLPAVQAKGEKKGAQDEAADPFQSLGVKSIGVLGRLALSPAPVELNREIGVFLLTILAAIPETPAADAVEAMNQIFDIYDDKSYPFDEAVFWADGFYKHLEEILPKTKKMAKAIDKRISTELRARADEAIMNLGRFLIYKRKEKSRQE